MPQLPDGSAANTGVLAADQTGQSSLLDALLVASVSLPSLSNSPLLPATGEPSSVPPSVPSSASTLPISSTSSAFSRSTSSTTSPSTTSPSASSLSTSSSSTSVVAAHQSPRAALRAWRTSLGHDVDSSRVTAGLQNRVIDITAPSAMLAAQGFLTVCKAICQGTGDEPVLPEDVEITDCTPLNMVIGSITANM